ncbi:MAG: hypothetical protein HGA33_00705 [Candidatus Moranbacteria bacterium]|nr:hypothetical protein [Candidatus Moranbacteria bacterium]
MPIILLAQFFESLDGSRIRSDCQFCSLKKILLVLFLFAYGIGSVVFIGRMLYRKKTTKI